MTTMANIYSRAVGIQAEAEELGARTRDFRARVQDLRARVEEYRAKSEVHKEPQQQKPVEEPQQPEESQQEIDHALPPPSESDGRAPAPDHAAQPTAPAVDALKQPNWLGHQGGRPGRKIVKAKVAMNLLHKVAVKLH